jgi:hypothetical protein
MWEKATHSLVAYVLGWFLVFFTRFKKKLIDVFSNLNTSKIIPKIII